MDIDTLYPLVTEAIRRAEALEDINAPEARRAFSEVSRLEERIASLLPLCDYEGVIARRGAVRAAINAREFGRAQELAARFEDEDGVDDALAADLVALKAQAAVLAERENLPTKKPARRAAVHDGMDAKGGALTDDLMEAIGRAPGTFPTGENRARKTAMRARGNVLSKASPKPKKSG
jgi:hypothetical protein